MSRDSLVTLYTCLETLIDTVEAPLAAEETPAGTYPVLTTQDYAGKSILETPLPDKHIFRINTGGPLPLGADAVIMVEDTELASSYSSADGCNGKKLGEEKEVTLLAKVDKGENVRMPGSDVKKGEKVLDKGTRISAVGGEIGTLAFVGKKEVRDLFERARNVHISNRAALTYRHPSGHTYALFSS